MQFKKLLQTLLVLSLPSSALATPLLGQTQAQVEEILGKPLGDAKNSSGEVLAQIYCVGGLYLSDWYKPDGKTLTQMVPIKPVTVGPCSSDSLSPISLYARYVGGVLSMAAYTTRYQHTLDRGWGIFMDGLIADEGTTNLDYTALEDLQSQNLRTEKGFRYVSGLSTQHFLPLEQSTMVGVAWYAPGVVADGEKNALNQFLLEQHKRLEGY